MNFWFHFFLVFFSFSFSFLGGNTARKFAKGTGIYIGVFWGERIGILPNGELFYVCIFYMGFLGVNGLFYFSFGSGVNEDFHSLSSPPPSYLKQES